jgi:hypothetical protein
VLACEHILRSDAVAVAETGCWGGDDPAAIVLSFEKLVTLR